MYLIPPPGCCCDQPAAHSSSWNMLPTLDWDPGLCQVFLLSQGWLSVVTQEITETLLRVWPCPAQRSAKAHHGHPYRNF